MEQTINANLSACLQTAHHIGFSRVHNICNGTKTDIPWGAADWVLGLSMAGAFAVLIAMMAGMAIVMFSEF